MLLKLYDLEHKAVKVLKGVKDARVESECSSGEKKLYFSWYKTIGEGNIPHEYYIRTDNDEFVVKENSQGSDGWREIVAVLNTEDIEGRVWQDFTAEDCTAKDMADYALAGTGWTCVCDIPESRIRSVSLKKVTSYSVLKKIQEAFTCEIKFESLDKVVYLMEQVGEDRGAYFIKGLNLTELKNSEDSYDYATRIIPIGANGIGIEGVNNGVAYLENHQYSSKTKTIIWEDSNYTDAQALKEDAEKKLAEISKPKRTIQVKVIDLAKINEEYSTLAYEVGDTVLVIDQDTETKEKQRIVKTVEYLEEPERNTCELSNTTITFEELQQKMFAAAECIGNITTDNGTVKGAAVDKIDITQIIGLERYLAEDLDELRANYLYIQTELGATKAVIGKGILTETETTSLKVTGQAEIESASLGYLSAGTIEVGYAKFDVIESENISALEARIDKITATDITTEYLESHYAKIDYANVDTATIRQGFLKNLMVSQGMVADRVQAGQIVATDVLTGVRIYADDITAGTLSVERLILRGNNKSLLYALNNSGGLVSKQVDTLDAGILTNRTVTADKIVAKSITATEINVGNLISSGFIGTNKLTANNINVNNLLAQSITATGTIQSGNYKAGTSGNFSSAGLMLNMATGQFISKKFIIDGNGNAEFAGKVKGAQIEATTISGGTITGAQIKGNTISGGVISGTTISGGTIGATTITGGNISGAKITSERADGKAKAVIERGTVLTEGDLSGKDRNASLMYGILDLRSGADNNSVSIDSDKFIMYGNRSSKFNVEVDSDSFTTQLPTRFYKNVTVDGVFQTESNAIVSGLLQAKGNATVGGYVQAVGNVVSNNIVQGTYLRAGTTTINGNVVSNSGNALYLKNSTRKLVLSNSEFRVSTDDKGAVTLGSSSCKWGQIYSTKSAISTSDRNQKKNIQYYGGEKIKKYEDLFGMLEPCLYMFDNPESDRMHSGFISQDIEMAMAKAGVSASEFAAFCKDKIEEGDECEYVYSLRYEEFIPLNTHMIQKTRKEAEQQQREFAYYKEQMEKKLNKLEKKMASAERRRKRSLWIARNKPGRWESKRRV